MPSSEASSPSSSAADCAGRITCDGDASPSSILRIPGLGVRNVDRILVLRRHKTLVLGDLARLRVAVRRASPFLAFAGGTDVSAARKLDALDLARRVRPPTQLSLFESKVSAVTGEL